MSRWRFSFTGETFHEIVEDGLVISVYDSKHKFGGICHLSQSTEELISLLKKFKSQGSTPESLVLKLVGGKTIKAIQLTTHTRELARELGLNIATESLHDVGGRELIFSTKTGELQYRIAEISNSKIRSQLAKKIKVLIIDDSLPIRKVIRKMLESEPQFEIVGEAKDPIDGEILRKSKNPDVITLDLHMPRQDGVSYIKQLMKNDPTAIIVITDYDLKNTGPVMDALDAGAFDYIQKPNFSQLTEVGEILISKIREAAKVDTAKLSMFRSSARGAKDMRSVEKKSFNNYNLSIENSAVIAIGASTGGTEALKVVLGSLPAEIPPILVVQHMPPVFTKSFAERLNELCPFHVKEAEDGERVLPGCVYIAPGGFHMGVVGSSPNLKIQLSSGPPENRFRPSVDFLFRSIGKIKRIKKFAVILTGMGNDGAQELLNLRQQGAHTIAQDESTSVVFGMPKVAIDLGAAQEVKRLDQIGPSLVPKRIRSVS